MKYYIRCWIPAEPEEDEPEDPMDYKTAKSLLEHYRLLQPENIYKLVRVDVDGGIEEEILEE
jgi:hypothetical protein